MAISNHERVGKALELLTSGLKPFVERELKNIYQQGWFEETRKTMAASQLQFLGNAETPQWDAQSLLLTLWNQWNDVFRKTLGQAERTLCSELREVRNRWAHQRPFSTDDAYRLYTICERRKWSKEALAYNALVLSWSDVTKLAQQAGAGGPTQDKLL